MITRGSRQSGDTPRPDAFRSHTFRPDDLTGQQGLLQRNSGQRQWARIRHQRLGQGTAARLVMTAAIATVVFSRPAWADNLSKPSSSDPIPLAQTGYQETNLVDRAITPDQESLKVVTLAVYAGAIAWIISLMQK